MIQQSLNFTTETKEKPAGIDLLTGLNPAQRDAVTTTDGPLLILAGAGSGKTRVICHRIAHLIDSGAEPASIFTVTFTNKAADEMLTRVKNLTGIQNLRLWISTFHSAAVRMLRADIESLGRKRDFTIYDAGDSTTLVKQILKDLGHDPKEEKPRKYVEIISRAKDELLSPDEWIDQSRLPRLKAELIHMVYTEYQERLHKSNALDFGDLLVEAVRLLSIPEIAAKYQRKFRYIMVDEYQDTNRAQYRMVRILSEGSRNICVVGDDDQSIYEWRGADRRNIMAFETDYQDTKVVELYRNYRSTQPILDAASRLISCNTRLREKRLFTEKDTGSDPEIWCCANEYQEVEKVIDDVRINRREGAALSDHAVFYRVHAQSRVIEEIFSASGIPYQILNGVSFYQRAEIKDVTAYLKVLANPADDLSLIRIINKPARGIGDTTVARLREAAGGRPMLEYLREIHQSEDLRPAARKKLADFSRLVEELTQESHDLGIADLIRRVLIRTDFMSQYNMADPDEATRIENVKEYLSAAEEFQSSSYDPSLTAFLERISLASDVDQLDNDADAVILTTLHSAKGLEFPNVYIMGCEEFLFPHPRAYDDSNDAALEEERRLAYVGITRAEQKLALSYCEERRWYGRLVYNRPSRFLKETGLLEAPVQEDIADQEPVYTTVMKAPARKHHASGDDSIFTEGDVVTHRKFGKGRVIYVSDSGDENEVVRVKFARGVKDLMRKYANLSRV